MQRPPWAPGGPSAGRLGRQEARIVGLADSSSENAGFAQAAGMGVPRAKSPRRQAELDNFCIEVYPDRPIVYPLVFGDWRCLRLSWVIQRGYPG